MTLESRIERYKQMYAHKNYIMFEHTERTISGDNESFQIIDLDTPIDWQLAAKQCIKTRKKILHVNIPDAAKDERKGEAMDYVQGLMGMIAANPTSPAEIKTADKMDEVKARLGKKAKGVPSEQ